jgi:ATP-binding cassette subfamily B protein
MREKGVFESLQTPHKKSKNYKSLNLFLSLFWTHRKKVILAMLASIIAGASTLSMGWLLKHLLDHGIHNHHDLMHLLMMLGGVLIVMIVCSFGRIYYLSFVGESTVKTIRTQLFDHILKLDPPFFEHNASGGILSTLNTDMNLIQVLLSTSLGIGVRNIFIIVGGIITMVMASPKLAVYSIFIIPMVVFVVAKMGKRVKKASYDVQQTLSNISGYLEENVSNIKTLQSLNLEQRESAQFSMGMNVYFKKMMRLVVLKSTMTVVVMAIVFTFILFLLWVGGSNVMNQTMTLGQLSSFLFYAITVAGSGGSFTELMADFQRAAGASERIMEIFNARPLVMDPIQSREPVAGSHGVIAFHRVSFHYPQMAPLPQTNRNVLNETTFSVNPGEKVALVGLSGAGKSTIFNLLLKFYSPQSGAIYLDGVDYREQSAHFIRSVIGYVPQEPDIFSTTIYDNVACGHPNANADTVDEALHAASLWEFIRTLKDGLHTQLGTHGMQLSGGQKQRIAIARALIRNPVLLLLDEATNSLDAESEFAIQKSLKMFQKTTLIIAHRLATVLQSDRIIVLDKGQIQAVGTHAELVAQEGLYRRLALLQFSDVPKLHV